MTRAEIYGFAGAALLGFAFACMKPSLAAFVGWPAGMIGVALLLAVPTRLP